MIASPYLKFAFFTRLIGMRSGSASAVRAFAGTIAGVSWLLISNHCTIVSAAEANEVKPAEHVCPMHASAPIHRQAPAKQLGDQLCCKSLHATAAKLSLARVLPLRASFVAVLSDPSPFEIRVERTSPPLCLDTGPPPSHSFSELVLQRSLLAHAPPIVA
jgi:hypothetical protein